MINFSETPLASIGAIRSFARAAKTTSLINASAPSRVEPVTLIDNTIALIPEIDDVLQSALNMFSCYYLLAFDLSIPINGINVLKRLDQLNPNRSVSDAVLSTDWAEESYHSGLGVSTMEGINLFDYTEEASNTTVNHYGGQGGNARARGGNASVGNINVKTSSGDKGTNQSSHGNQKELRESDNLSVGKMLELTIKEGSHEARFNVMVRLMARVVRADILANVLTMDRRKLTVIERWHQMRSGEISFFADYLLGRDLIKAHRKNLVNDDTGIYKAEIERNRKNTVAGLVSGRPSLAGSSTIAVVSRETANQIERTIRGRLTDKRKRDDFFSKNNLMTLVVVDPDDSTVTFFSESINTFTEVTFNQLKRVSQSKNQDLLPLLSAFKDSKSPIL